MRYVRYALKVWWVKCDEMTQATLRIVAPIAAFGLGVEWTLGSPLPSSLNHAWVYLGFAVLLTAMVRQASLCVPAMFKSIDE